MVGAYAVADEELVRAGSRRRVEQQRAWHVDQARPAAQLVAVQELLLRRRRCGVLAARLARHGHLSSTWTERMPGGRRAAGWEAGGRRGGRMRGKAA